MPRSHHYLRGQHETDIETNPGKISKSTEKIRPQWKSTILITALTIFLNIVEERYEEYE